MNNQVLEKTQQFVFDILKMTNQLPKLEVAILMGNEILKSATSIEANYRTLSNNNQDINERLCCCEKNTVETSHWLMLLSSSNFIEKELAHKLLSDVNELDSLFTKSITKNKEARYRMQDIKY